MYNYYPMVSFLYQHTNKTCHFVSGSKDVITWMNRYGHAISSDKVNLVETNTAEIQASILSRTFMPRIMQPSTFATFAFDNCDHNLESKFNLTMHCTNGVMIQKCQKTDNRILTHNPILQQAESRKRRSFNPVQQDLAPFIKQPRSKPTTFYVVDININEIDALHSKNMDRVWYLVKAVMMIMQSFLVGRASNDVHNVVYLRTIAESPTKLASD